MFRIKRITNPLLKSGVNQYLAVILVIALTALLCRSFIYQQGYYIVSFILLFVVSIMAIFMGIGPILLASTISALVWNFFFIPPHFEFHIERTEDKLMFVSFFFIALLNGVLTNRIRQQEALAIEREERTNAIFELTRELSNTSGVNEIITVAFRDIARFFEVTSFWFLREGEKRPEIIVQKGEEHPNAKIDYGIAGWVLKNSMKAGRFTEFYSETSLTYYPLTGKRVNPGIVAVQFKSPLEGEKEAFWQGYLAQVSNALEREMLNELALKARILDESDRLYKTLFTLISHEFRIPIATIMGASDTLMMPQASQGDREQLFSEISKASSRLNHLVENLLNMSRLESGKISAHTDWCDINDLIYKVSKTLKQELSQFNFRISIPADMPLVRLDFGLMEQVIYNLLLNSCQYAPPGSVIGIIAGISGNDLSIIVEDNGMGFPDDFLAKVFRKFTRADSSKAGGLGLGLSIVKGLVEAHKGTVTAENSSSGGARVVMNIPTEITEINNIKIE